MSEQTPEDRKNESVGMEQYERERAERAKEQEGRFSGIEGRLAEVEKWMRKAPAGEMKPTTPEDLVKKMLGE